MKIMLSCALLGAMSFFSNASVLQAGTWKPLDDACALEGNSSCDYEFQERILARTHSVDGAVRTYCQEAVFGENGELCGSGSEKCTQRVQKCIRHGLADIPAAKPFRINDSDFKIEGTAYAGLQNFPDIFEIRELDPATESAKLVVLDRPTPAVINGEKVTLTGMITLFYGRNESGKWEKHFWSAWEPKSHVRKVVLGTSSAVLKCAMNWQINLGHGGGVTGVGRECDNLAEGLTISLKNGVKVHLTTSNRVTVQGQKMVTAGETIYGTSDKKATIRVSGLVGFDSVVLGNKILFPTHNKDTFGLYDLRGAYEFSHGGKKFPSVSTIVFNGDGKVTRIVHRVKKWTGKIIEKTIDFNL